jgi:hypothetical protein
MRKLLSWYSLCTLILLFTTNSLQAQIAVMRNYFPAPLEDTTYEKGLFGKLAFSAEGSRGFGSALGEQAWNIKYIGFVELYRFNRNSAIAGSLGHEFTANPHNEISFHMRGAIWNETIAYFHKLKPITFEAGITHHCRHEIDNSIPADEREVIPDYVPTRRLIVLTSPYISVQSSWLKVKKLQARFYSRLNLYTYAVDGRRPSTNMEQSLEYVRASALIGARLNYLLSEKLQLYTRGFYNPVYFIEDAPFKNNFRLEAGGAALGEKGNFELFAAYEYFFDDMSRPYPLPSNVVSIGIRGRSAMLF